MAQSLNNLGLHLKARGDYADARPLYERARAIYEKVFRRQANLQALAPVAVAVVVLFAFIGVVSILLDLTNPIDLGG